MMKKVILVENQISQFTKLSVLLKYKYSLFPKHTKDFIDFMDLIRVFLNPRYGKLIDDTTGEFIEDSIRKKTFDKILTIIRNEKPNLIVLDNILVGNHEGENGIFFAKILRKLYKEQPLLPIIFLTRTNKSSVKIKKDLSSITHPFEWLEKGYFKGENLSEEYIKEILIPKIEDLIKFNLPISNDSIKDEIESLFKLIEDLPHDHCKDYAGYKDIYIRIHEKDFQVPKEITIAYKDLYEKGRKSSFDNKHFIEFNKHLEKILNEK